MALEPLPEVTRPYDQSFTRWVARNVKGGDKLALCMQCGTCSGSCRTAVYYEHGPRMLFAMIRAGNVHDVMTSTTLHGCGRCYLCVSRCPRGIPVAHIIRDLGQKADELGYSIRPVGPDGQPIPDAGAACPTCAAAQ